MPRGDAHEGGVCVPLAGAYLVLGWCVLAECRLACVPAWQQGDRFAAEQYGTLAGKRLWAALPLLGCGRARGLPGGCIAGWATCMASCELICGCSGVASFH